jgi:hypothetical protein
MLRREPIIDGENPRLRRRRNAPGEMTVGRRRAKSVAAAVQVSTWRSAREAGVMMQSALTPAASTGMVRVLRGGFGMRASIERKVCRACSIV